MTKSKKFLASSLFIALAASLCFSMAACNDKKPTPPPEEPKLSAKESAEKTVYYSYTDDQWKSFWLDETYKSKTVNYQLYGAMEDAGSWFTYILNLNSDGSAVGYSKGILNTPYFGYWGIETTEDGKLIYLKIDKQYCDGFFGQLTEGISDYDYTYPEIYETSDGSFSLSIDYNKIPGMYNRAITITGNSTVKYSDLITGTDEYYAEVSKPAE